MHVTDLGGHSGCKILLCETDNNTVFVRKISGSQDYNKRLETQAWKQAEFHNEIIKAPVVINSGYTEGGVFYFDMEYIQGITLAEYMKSVEIGKVRSIVERIIYSMSSGDGTGSLDAEGIFQEKITDIRNRLWRKGNPVVDEALELLSGHSWQKFHRSSCHGDLTLENIIVKDNQLYFIDFLDSFYDCWILDIATLMQDVQTLWSYRFQKEININTLLRLIVFRDILMDLIKRDERENYHLEVYYALLLKLLRIYPYTTDANTYLFLNKKTRSVMDLIAREEDALCVH